MPVTTPSPLGLTATACPWSPPPSPVVRFAHNTVPDVEYLPTTISNPEYGAPARATPKSKPLVIWPVNRTLPERSKATEATDEFTAVLALPTWFCHTALPLESSLTTKLSEPPVL